MPAGTGNDRYRRYIAMASLAETFKYWGPYCLRKSEDAKKATANFWQLLHSTQCDNITDYLYKYSRYYENICAKPFKKQNRTNVRNFYS